ncbi:MAG: AI-2E family transporter, partial [Cyclobacteriaceae bacterium]
MKKIKSDPVVRAAAWLLLIGLVLTFMILGQQILIPLTWALVFAFILFPFCDWMEEKGIGRTWSSLFATLIFTILSGVILFYLVYQSFRILQQEGAIYDTLHELYDSTRMWFYDRLGLEVFHPDEGAQLGTDSLGRVINFAAREISSIGQNVVTITLIPMFLFFLLLYRGLAMKFTRARYEGKNLEQLENFFQRSEYSIQNYLWGTLILTGITSAMAYIILLLFGIKYAFFFGIFIGVLNLIPYIGNLAAFIVVLLFVYVTQKDFGTTIFCGLAVYAANLIQEN